MTYTDDIDTERFESPKELARHLFDQAVRPEDGGNTRLLIAILSAKLAKEKWLNRQQETTDDLENSAETDTQETNE